MKVLAPLLVYYIVRVECSSFSFHYDTVTVCDGKKSMEYIWSTRRDVSKIRCVTMCDSVVVCVLVSYNIHTRVCYLHTHTLFDLLPTMTPDSSYTCLLPKDYLESWMTSFIRSSPSVEGYTPEFLIDEIDRWVWIPLPGTKPYIEFNIEMEMYVERIYIYDVLGSVPYSDISVRDPVGDWVAVWSGPQVLETVGDRIFSPELMITNFKTSALRLDLYLFVGVGKLDAVKVVGKGNQRLRN